MIRNYIKLAIRNLQKRSIYSLINITGLAIGIAVCLVIWKYVEFELSYDNFHQNGQNIYRLTSSFYTSGAREPYTGYDLGPALLNDMPEVKSIVRVHDNDAIVSYKPSSGKSNRFQESNIKIVDSTFLDVFTFEVIKGDKASALNRPYSIVMTESIANKYFGNHVDPVGKILRLTEGWVQGDYEVTAVLKDIPENSHLTFDFLLPVHNLLLTDFYHNNHARWDNFHTYVETYDESDLSNLESKIPLFIKKYRGEDKNINTSPVFKFQPISQIHFSPDLNREGSHLNTIYFFVILSIFILAIAWANYINLSTAKAMERAREVGVKKVIGAQRIQLIIQFLFESIVINLLSVILAIGLAIFLLPILGEIVDRNFSFEFGQPKLWLLLFSIFVIGTLISGIYPAFFLSSYKTVEVIKGKIVKSHGGILRKSLVIFQFSASLLLIAGTFIVLRQINFMQNENKSLSMDQILILNGPHLSDRQGINERLISFKNELKQINSISHVATSASIPGGGANINTLMRKAGALSEANRNGDIFFIDTDFIETYGIELIAGKTWNPISKSEMNSVLINEAAVDKLGLGNKENALNERVVVGSDTLAILGVFKNYHWNSIHSPYAPLLLVPEKISGSKISIKLSGGNINQSLKLIEKKFKATFPDDPFIYSFLNDLFNQQYKSEQQFSKIFGAFSILAIIIACLGLGGLVSFSTSQRLKEISIRKVLGASVSSVVSLLSTQFLQLILIACLIALPATWYGATVWLEKFAFKIGLSWDIFLFPVFGLIIITLLSVSIIILRGANINPARILKSE